MRSAPVIRIIQELLRLERARVGVTLDELADESGVTTRTIRRDLEALQAAGVPLVDDTDERGRRRWRVFEWRKEAA
jgi:predicted DNA-binding transcriptional regulator YafY